MRLALPLPVLDHVLGTGQGLHLLAGELVKLVPVVVAADAAVLALGGGGRDDLHEVAIVHHPHAEEGVHVVAGAPAEDPREQERKC